MVLLVAAQGDDMVQQAIDQLRQEVAQLGLRVSKLEHAGGSYQAGGQSDGSSGSYGSAAPPPQTMIVGGVSQSNHSDDNSQEIAQLQRDVSSLKSTVTQQQQSVDKDTGQAVKGQTTQSGWKHTSDRDDINQQIQSQREVVDMYSTQLAMKEQKLQQLQDADSQPKQIIHGHEGHTVITLESKFDLSRSLRDIQIGDLVTWTGTRVSVDSGSETWKIDTIKKAD